MYSLENHFSHSTPNHHSPGKGRSRSPGVESSITDNDNNIILPIFKQNRTKFQIPINYEEKGAEVNKKQKLIRELAANILELNRLRNHSEKIENQFKLISNDNKTSAKTRGVGVRVDCRKENTKKINFSANSGRTRQT